MNEFVGTGADDAFIAKTTTLNALDDIDGGAGTDSLTIVEDEADVLNFGSASISNIEKVSITTGGDVGAIAVVGTAAATAATAAVPEVDTISLSKTGWTAGDTATVTIGGITYTTDAVVQAKDSYTVPATIASADVLEIVIAGTAVSVTLDGTTGANATAAAAALKAAINADATLSAAGISADNALGVVTVSGNTNGTDITTAVGTTAHSISSGTVSLNNAVAVGKTIYQQTVAKIEAVLGDSVTAGSLTSGTGTATTDTFTLTAKEAGRALPTIAVADVSTSGTITVANTTPNTVGDNLALAVKEVLQIAIGDGTTSSTSTDPDAGDVVTVTIDGVPYIGGAAASSTAGVAETVVALINSALGAGTASVASGSSNIIVTAPTAGTPLPNINVSIANASEVTDTHTVLVSNAALADQQGTAVDAVTLAAPAGTTEYTVKASGLAKVSGAKTTDITASGTAVQVSGGADVNVTTKSSAYVAGATGAVTVTDTTTATATAGSFYVATSAANTGLSSAWGTSTSYQAGTLVTGGTDVTVTGAGGKMATVPTSVASQDSGIIQIGSDALVGTATANIATGKQSILNAAMSPTGDVVVNQSSAGFYLDSTNSAVVGTTVYGNGAVSVYMNGGESANVWGADTVTIKDLGVTALKASSSATAVVGTSNLSTVVLKGLNGSNADATIESDALTSLTVVDARGTTPSVTITNNTEAHSLNLTLGNSGVSGTSLTVADAEAVSVVIDTVASGSAIGAALSNTGSANFLTLNTPKATTITMTNEHSVSLGDLTASGYGKVGSINGADATGSINATIGAVPKQGLEITTGSGDDVMVLKASTSQSSNSTTGANLSLSLGAGDDILANGNTTVHTVVGATFDGGEGTDTVYASLINNGNAAQFTNFEVLGLDLTTNGSAIDASIFADAETLLLIANAATSGHTVTYSGLSQTQGLVVGSSMGSNAGTTVLGFGVAEVAGTADSYTVTFAADGALTAAATPTEIKAATLSLAYIENINLVSGGSGYTNNTVTLADPSAKTVTITGEDKMTLTFASGFGGVGSTNGTTAAASTLETWGVNTIDASEATGDIVLNTTNVVYSYTSGVLGLDISTGSGNDEVTTTGVARVNLGAGDDKVTTANAVQILTGGAGDDTFIVEAAVGTTPEVTITDIESGDKIDFNGTMAAAGSLGEAEDVGTATSLASALDAANGATVASGSSPAVQLVWFQYGGNTYIYNDLLDSNSAGGTVDALDNIVKLTGLIDLEGSAYTTGAVLTIG